MIPELGHFALILGFFIALTAGVLPLWGAHVGHPAWIAVAKPATRTLTALVLFSFACLSIAFLQNDFSVVYVAQHSNSLLPPVYRFAAVWGGHEGSLLLWLLMLTFWMAAVSFLSRSLPPVLVARVLGTLGIVAAGFLLFILLTSNPFDRLLPPAPEGRDLNPLLQDPGLVIHPPLLYMGYVGFSVAYAFAIAALLSGQLDAAWARWSRPWTMAAWVFLTLGIAMGSWWAYYELGWGGWWFWDPVENASFMPWLVGTALIHSLIVTEKRGCFKNWTVLLAIAAFSLSLLGTFLVRSGVLTSVHAFATDPARGIFVLAFLAVVIGTSLALFAWRAPKVGLGGSFDLLSRESFLLINNVLLVVASATVLLGTLYPLLMDALGLGKISVGPPYFNAVFVPVMLPLLCLMGLGPFVRWKQDQFSRLLNLRWLLGVSLVLALALFAALGGGSPMVAVSLLLSVWIILTVKFHFYQRTMLTQGNTSALRALFRQPLHFWGMHCAHAGIAVFVIGVTLVSTYSDEKDIRMVAGDTLELQGYTFRFNGVDPLKGPNYSGWRGDVSVLSGNRILHTLQPEKRAYVSSSMPMTEAAIDSGLFRDLYVSLGEPMDREHPEGAWALRIYVKPFVDWIWGGCLLMALGGILSLLDRRYRPKKGGAA